MVFKHTSGFLFKSCNIFVTYKRICEVCLISQRILWKRTKYWPRVKTHKNIRIHVPHRLKTLELILLRYTCHGSLFCNNIMNSWTHCTKRMTRWLDHPIVCTVTSYQIDSSLQLFHTDDFCGTIYFTPSTMIPHEWISDEWPDEDGLSLAFIPTSGKLSFAYIKTLDTFC